MGDEEDSRGKRRARWELTFDSVDFEDPLKHLKALLENDEKFAKRLRKFCDRYLGQVSDNMPAYHVPAPSACTCDMLAVMRAGQLAYARIASEILEERREARRKKEKKSAAEVQGEEVREEDILPQNLDTFVAFLMLRAACARPQALAQMLPAFYSLEKTDGVHVKLSDLIIDLRSLSPASEPFKTGTVYFGPGEDVGVTAGISPMNRLLYALAASLGVSESYPQPQGTPDHLLDTRTFYAIPGNNVNRDRDFKATIFAMRARGKDVLYAYVTLSEVFGKGGGAELLKALSSSSTEQQQGGDLADVAAFLRTAQLDRVEIMRLLVCDVCGMPPQLKAFQEGVLACLTWSEFTALMLLQPHQKCACTRLPCRERGVLPQVAAAWQAFSDMLTLRQVLEDHRQRMASAKRDLRVSVKREGGAPPGQQLVCAPKILALLTSNDPFLQRSLGPVVDWDMHDYGTFRQYDLEIIDGDANGNELIEVKTKERWGKTFVFGQFRREPIKGAHAMHARSVSELREMRAHLGGASKEALREKNAAVAAARERLFQAWAQLLREYVTFLVQHRPELEIPPALVQDAVALAESKDRCLSEAGAGPQRSTVR